MRYISTVKISERSLRITGKPAKLWNCSSIDRSVRSMKHPFLSLDTKN